MLLLLCLLCLLTGLQLQELDLLTLGEVVMWLVGLSTVADIFSAPDCPALRHALPMLP